MKEEYFDIVDENDLVIGKAPRSECHSNPNLTHRGVFVIPVNKKEEILISKRSMKKDTNPGKWELLAEHNKLGESYYNAAVRGVREELGISTIPVKITKIKISSNRETEFDEIFLCRIIDEKISFDKNEITEIRFMSPKKLRQELKHTKELFTAWFLKVISKYFKYIK